MTDKKDPIQEASEELTRLLEHAAKKRHEEKLAEIAEENREIDLSDVMEEVQALADEKQQEERELIRKRLVLAMKLRELEGQVVEQAEGFTDEETQIMEETIQSFEELEPTDRVDAMSRYVDNLKKHKPVQIKEGADLLGGGDAPVTRAELQALKTSLASLGGGGVGDLTQLVSGNPSDGQTITYNATTNQFQWSTVAGVGGSDSGLDSAAVLSLINDSYVSNLIGILNNQTAVTFGSPDSAGDINNIYNILNIDSSFTLIQNSGNDSNSIWYILGIDSSDTISTYSDSDVIDLLNDSGVQNILPQLDSTYDLGDSSRRWKDLWLSGNTIHLGDVAISSQFHDSGVGVYANGRRLAYADSYENGLDSVNVIRLIDSALDSLGLLGYTTVDHDSDTKVYLGTDSYALLDTTKQLRYSNVYDSVGALPNASTYHGMFAHVHATGAGYFAHAGNWIQLANNSDLPDSGYTTADHDSDTLVQVDSAYVQARIGELYDTPDHDSDTLVQVDSAYVRARVKTDQDLQTTDTVTFDKVFSHFEGHTEFTARNETGSTVLAGTPVTITGVSGTTPTIGLASATTTPAYGLIHEDANDNAECLVVSAGPLTGLDTSAYSVGTVLYVDTVAGQLTDVPPSGVNNSIQNIGKVLRSHASSGTILVVGAGRANATPNLDAGYIFYGSDSNRSVATDLTSVVDSAYVQARVTFPADQVGIDSSVSIGLTQSTVDSAYVQSRVTFPADQVGIDSATSISLTQSTVDSAYVQTRVDASQLDFSGVPTSDPLSAGLVWRDSDNGNVLKVSVG